MDRNKDAANKADYEAIGAEIVAETLREQMREKVTLLRHRMRRLFLFRVDAESSQGQRQSP